MKKLLRLAFFLISLISFSQCPPDGVFNSQGEIDAFAIDYPNCNQLDFITISGTDVTDLTPFLNIDLESRGIGIYNNPLLTTLEGLQNIVITTDSDSPAGLGIQNNALLMSIEHLPDFSSPTSIGASIVNNPSLQNLNGLSYTEVADQVIVRNNNALVNLEGLEALIFADLIIEDNNGLVDLQGLDSYLGYEFVLNNNSSLMSLNGLNPNADLPGFQITNNTSLTDISELSLDSFNFGGFNLSANSSLSVCNVEAICNALITFGSFEIYIENNAMGCNSIEEVKAACPDCPLDGIFTSQEEIDAFPINYPNCTEFSGLLRISGDDITDLSGLSNIESAGELEIENNPLLVNLNGLEGLAIPLNNVYSHFYIKNNALLEDISGLSGVTGFLVRIIYISDNPKLQSLNGLEGITGTEDTCHIINNDMLIDLSGLNNFTGCDDLYIEDNDALENINGLAPNFGTGRFYFLNNDAAVTLTATSALDPICGVVIQDNDMLENLNGLDGVNELECSLEIIITDNPSLSLCSNSYICSYVSALDVNWDIIEVNNNALGCNTVFEISNGCDQAPFNDECDGGELEELVIGQYYNVSLDLATMSPYTPVCNDVPDRADVWFTFNSGNYTNLTLSVGSDNSFQLWEGDCSNLSVISELCGSGQINFDTPQNKQYYLQLWANDLLERSSELVGDFEILVTNELLSQDEFTLLDFKLYPNPINNKLNLSSNKSIERAYIYDIQGKLIQKLEINSNQATLNMSEYKTGVFFLKVVSDNKTLTKKIIKD